jgi:hypothetical protein
MITLIPISHSDAVSTVLLVEWQLTTDYLDGDVLNGPVPCLFAPDPAIAKAAITNDPTKAFKDVQRLHSPLHIGANRRGRGVGIRRKPEVSKSSCVVLKNKRKFDISHKKLIVFRNINFSP